MANIVLDFLHNYQTGERRETEPANAYQYDEGHVLEAVLPEVITACEIHYWIRGMEEADAYEPTSITPNEDDSCTVLGNIPNKYFETNGELRIYIVVTDGTASITTYEGKLHICQRSMPDDYVDDDPENEATRILTEAQAAAATATAAAQTAQDVADSIPADYTQLSDDVSQLKEDYHDIDDRVTTLEQGGTGGGLTEDIKQALLQIAEKVAYVDAQGQDYYNALEDALYPPVDLVSISAVYTQSGTVYDTDTLDSLKPDLVVTAHMSDSTTQTVTEYTLSGTLAEGTSTITVTYGGKTAAFNVTVTHATPTYVTNGLIHHFDAIDNTDNGHDSTSTTWTDLVGTDVLTMNSTSYASWESDALVLSGTNDQYLLGSDQADTVSENTMYTVEVVIAPDGDQSSMVAIPFQPNTNSIGAIALFSDNTFNVKGKKSITYTHSGSSLSDVRHIAGTYNGNNVSSAYINGMVATAGSVQHSLSYSNITTMLIGQSGLTGASRYPYKGRIYAIRVYNRVLTDAEIAQNYAVDVERFSL